MIPHVNDSKLAESENNDYEIKAKEIPWHHRLVLDRPSKVIITLLLLAVLAPLLFYHYVFFPSLDLPPSDGFSVGSCLLPRTARLPCGFTEKQSECHPQCCFNINNNVCFHRFPSRFSYILDEDWSDNSTMRPRIPTVPFQDQQSYPELKLFVDEISATHMSLNLYNSENIAMEGRRIEEKYYTYHISKPELNIVINDSLGITMFNTVRGPIIASENIWEITFRLTEEYMYGLGEIPLIENTTKIIYNRGENSIPLIFSKTNKTFHGFLIDIIEPTEVTVQGENQVVVRSITRTGLKFHLFTGPTPKDIMSDVRNWLGFKDKLQYWMLGAHICSDNTASTDRQGDLQSFLEQASSERLPFDSHCGTSPVVFNDNQCDHDIEYKRNIVAGANLVRSFDKKFVPHVSPYIQYMEPNITIENNNSTEVSESTLTEEDIEDKEEIDICTNIIPEFKDLMLNLNEEIYKGKAGNYSVIYPDYESGEAKKLLTKLWTDTVIDGAVLMNSWPLDESWKFHNETYDLLPYFNKNFENAFNATPQWNCSRPNGELYSYTHNQYGNHFADAFRNTSQENIQIWTSSQRFHGDIVSKQGVNTTWAMLQNELSEIALGGVSGHWLWASPVCGDTQHFDIDTHVNLCVKWYMAATFFPLLNIHSKDTRRDPLVFSGTDKTNIVSALRRRLTLLPYIFTTLQDSPLLRPMFYQYPTSERLVNIRSQFSVGNDLLVVPNLHPDQTHVHVVMPPGTWYELWSGLLLQAEEGDAVTMTTTEADFLTLVRGGSIIVMQKNTQETAESTRLISDISLTIALECDINNNTQNNSTEIDDEDVRQKVEEIQNGTKINIHNISDDDTPNNDTKCLAKGTLHMTDDLKIIFEADAEKLKITSEGDDFNVICGMQSWSRRVVEYNIYGLDSIFNNNDHSRHVQSLIDLCQLSTTEEIVLEFLN